MYQNICQHDFHLWSIGIRYNLYNKTRFYQGRTFVLNVVGFINSVFGTWTSIVDLTCTTSIVYQRHWWYWYYITIYGLSKFTVSFQCGTAIYLFFYRTIVICKSYRKFIESSHVQWIQVFQIRCNGKYQFTGESVEVSKYNCQLFEEVGWRFTPMAMNNSSIEQRAFLENCQYV